jgi:transposase
VLQCLSTAGLVKGKTIGIDATTLEANAALRSIVRRDSGDSYEEFLTKLAKASGIGHRRAQTCMSSRLSTFS